MLENNIVIASQMLAKAGLSDRPRSLRLIYEKFGLDCEVFYIQALQDSNYKVRVAGIKILADLLGESALKYIEPMKNDKNFWVRRAVMKYCNKIKDGVS